MPIKRSHIAAVILAGALAVASSQLSAHHLSVQADCAGADMTSATGAACSFDKGDRLVAASAPTRPGIREVGSRYLPDASDTIDLREISKARLDPANRAFIRVVSWIGDDAAPEHAEERLAAR